MAETGSGIYLLTLGAFYRRVVVNPQRKRVSISRRYLWFFHRKYRIHFEYIEAITYGYEDWAPASATRSTYDSVDMFSVGIKDYGGEHWHLFSFFGDGSFINHTSRPDWYYWRKYRWDVSGTQEAESRVYVDLLSQMIEVPVIRPQH